MLVNSCDQCGSVVRCCPTPLEELLLLTSFLLCSLSARKLIMPYKSVPAGDTASLIGLSETHASTQHTVTGECVHNCGMS